MSFLENIKRKSGKKWIIFYSFFLTNILAIIGIIILLEPHWLDLNYYAPQYIGVKLNFVLLIFLILQIPLIYGSILLITFLKEILRIDLINPSKTHKFLPLIIILIYNILITLLLYLIQSYSKLILQRLEFRLIPIFLIISVILILLIYPIQKYGPELKKYLSEKKIPSKSKASIILTLITGMYFIIFAYPLINPPASVIYSDLPPKPDIIAHRGGAQLGPENTIEVADVALDYDIVGWEVDIAISKDGIPFLMHDETLTRTTDVEEVFPERKDERADSFKWKELRKLDAGSWYVEDDSWGLIEKGLITEKQADSYKGAKIPSFEEVLNFTREKDLILDFDVRDPPEDHPFHEDFIEILFNMTLNLTEKLNKIMIPTLSDEWLDLIEKYNASKIWTYENYVNTGDGYSNAKYRRKYRDDFPIMVYTINSIERFSQLWCLGVKWVKTDSPHKFADISEPIWYMQLEHYILLWIIFYIAAGTSLLLIRFKIKNEN
ncbi:MAG: hypothetical protein EU540_06070 [Promethearchaeota archaeon]|nr:MAG: hypothetical protein EU540_06070 [Candidatus Lokiarchaeota archaeon]